MLGEQLARAGEAERRHEPTGASPLDGRRYSPHELDLLRVPPSTLDDAIDDLVVTYEAAQRTERERLRGALTQQDLYTVFGFVRRKAVHTLRSGDPAHGERALLALAMVDAERVDVRDLLWAIDIGVASVNHTGGDASQALAAAAALSDASDLFRQRTSSTTFHGAGFHVVDGEVAGLVEYGGRPYEPRVDLATVGRAIAGVFEADGKRVTIRVASALPGVWFKLQHSDPEGDARGTVSILCREPEDTGAVSRHMLTAFLSELRSPAVAERYEERSHDHDGASHINLTLRNGRLLCVVIARAVDPRVDPVETTPSLERFRAGIADALAAAK